MPKIVFAALLALLAWCVLSIPAGLLIGRVLGMSRTPEEICDDEQQEAA